MDKSSMSVLIIEDDLIQAEGLKENLRELGYESILVTSSLDEVKSATDDSIFDIILADIELGSEKLKGTDIVQKLKLADQSIVIYLSSYDDNKYREKAVLSGGSAYLTKVVSKSQLDVAIDFAIRQKFYKGSSAEQEPHCPFYKGIDHVFIKSAKKFIKIRINEIVYIKADAAYCYIITPDKYHHISTSLNKFLEQAQISYIVRCHRSYAINTNHIESFEDDVLNMACNTLTEHIPLGNFYKDAVMSRLFKIKAE
jgi:two-component system, response regulator PdtaR